MLYMAAWSPSLERSARLRGADDCLDKTVLPTDVIAALRTSLLACGANAVA